MALNPFAIASAVFLALYAILFAYLLFSFITRRFALKSRWSLLLFHVTIRLAAQSVGLAFGVIGYSAVGLLVAFLVLSAEGYFTLVLCTLRLLISWQQRTSPSGVSWLEPRRPEGLSTGRRVLEALFFVDVVKSPMQSIHWVLIVGNVLIVVGGTMLAGGTTSTLDSWSVNADRLTTSKVLRGVGQALFLCMTIVVHACIVRELRMKTASSRERVLLLLLLATFPFMVIRGVFGVCQGTVNSLNYYYPDIYGPTGFTDEFVVKETVLATLMEWTTAAILLATSLLPTERQAQKTGRKEANANAELVQNK